jgi:hypothetical protein
MGPFSLVSMVRWIDGVLPPERWHARAHGAVSVRPSAAATIPPIELMNDG